MNLLTKFLLEDLLEEDNRDYIIYFDVDDTLSNYTQNLATTIIKDPETGEDRKIKPQDTVENIDYWLNAPIIPGAKEMVDFAKNNFNKVEVLSAVPELSKANKELTGKRFFDAPIDGKTEWVTKNIGSLPMNWSKNGKEKALWATPNSVLIDDKPENIKAFEQAGGIGILIDTPQNVITKLKDLLEGKEIINEGRYDSLTRMIVRDIMEDWKSQYNGTPGLLEYNEDYESKNSKGQSINFELYAVLNVKKTKTEVYRVNGGADPLRTPAYLEIKFQVDPRDLPKKWETIYNDLTDVVRHEIEHLTQAGSNVISSKEMEDDELLRNLITLKLLPKSEYFKLEKEVDAMLQGMYLKAKKSKTPFKDVIDDYFDKVKLNKKERQDILDLWKVRAKALSLPLQENIENINYKEKIQDLTKYMLDKGMNIRPLPKVIFVKDDVTNAEDFFGKTAYYSPERREIVLYTFGRHPKDIVRSFSHEMIHHIQNLEGRIGNGDITTTNTNEDDYLETIEKEAYLNGNIEFRKWSDSKNKLDEGVLEKTKNLISTFKSAYKDQTGDFKGFKELFTKYIKKQDLTPEEKEKLVRNVADIFKMSAIPILGISGTTLLGTLTNYLSKGKFSTFPSKFKDKLLPVNEINNYHQKALSQTEKEALKLTYKNWDKFGGKECNNGFCDIFAKNLSIYLPGSKIISTEDPRNNTLGHVWVDYEGKYFDAETPDGVNSWKQLPWMKEFFSKNKSYPTDIKTLNEVGEANLEPYKWEEINSGRTTSVEFTTPSETKYEVDLMHTEIDDPEDEDMSLEALDIEFLAKPKGAEGSSSKIVVNKGELYKVMSTIVDIIKHYLRQYKGDIKAIVYSPSKKSSEENFGSQRDNLYRAFILKAFPDAKIEQQGENIITYFPGNAIVTEADPKKGTGKKPKGSGRRLYTDEDPTDTVRVKFKTKEDIVDTLNKKSFKSKAHARQSQVINLIHQRVRAAYSKSKDPEVKARLKRALDYIEKRKEASKKKTERLRKMKEASDPQAGTALPYGSGFAPVKELITATDIICDKCGWEWAIKDGGNDLYICHKCWHDNTPKSDPFGLKAYARELVNDLKEEITKSDLNQIEKIADEWFEDYGIDVEFTYHFLERVNDPRNGKPISAEELEDLFIKTAEKYGKKLSDFPDNFEAVLNDLRTSINLPFALNYDARNDEMDLVAKTIMRKRDFKTTSPKLPLEELGKAKKGH
jgi:hypothetical protein